MILSEPWLYEQLQFISQVQQLNYPYYVSVNKIFSFLGEDFFVLLLTFLLWNGQRSLGLKLFFLLVISTLVVWLIKDMTHVLRPFVQDPQLYVIKASGYSFPSGDVYAATVVYGYLAYISRQWKYYSLASCIIFLVGYSRIALGVHFPFDVVCGLFFGLITLSCFVSVEARLEQLGNLLLKQQGMLLMVYLLTLASSTLLFSDKTPILLIGISSGVILGYYCNPIQKVNKLAANHQKTITYLILNLIGLSLAVIIFIGGTYAYKQYNWLEINYFCGVALGGWIVCFPYLVSIIIKATRSKL